MTATRWTSTRELVVLAGGRGRAGGQAGWLARWPAAPCCLAVAAELGRGNQAARWSTRAGRAVAGAGSAADWACCSASPGGGMAPQRQPQCEPCLRSTPKFHVQVRPHDAGRAAEDQGRAGGCWRLLAAGCWLLGSVCWVLEVCMMCACPWPAQPPLPHTGAVRCALREEPRTDSTRSGRASTCRPRELAATRPCARAGPDAEPAAVVPRGHLRLLRHEHGRNQRPGLPDKGGARLLGRAGVGRKQCVCGSRRGREQCAQRAAPRASSLRHQPPPLCCSPANRLQPLSSRRCCAALLPRALWRRWTATPPRSPAWRPCPTCLWSRCAACFFSVAGQRWQGFGEGLGRAAAAAAAPALQPTPTGRHTHTHASPLPPPAGPGG